MIYAVRYSEVAAFAWNLWEGETHTPHLQETLHSSPTFAHDIIVPVRHVAKAAEIVGLFDSVWKKLASITFTL